MSSIEFDRTDIGGHSIAYRHCGEGPALVLLHGFLCDSRCWRAQLRDLSDQFSVIAWDAPGAGASSDPPDRFTINDWAHCLAEFLSAVVGIERAHVLGLSWGGVLAQEYYRVDPEKVQTLILADTYAGWRGSLPQDVSERRLARCLRESALPADEFVRRWVPIEFFTEAASQDLVHEMADVVSDFHPHGFRLMAESLAETDTSDLLPTIEVPTLLLWGEHDQRSPLPVATRFRDAIPGAELEVITRAGHVSNMEQPEQFNTCVRRFCG
jgi:pimeloyl-ACP methyl ester carboxylesterase